MQHVPRKTPRQYPQRRFCILHSTYSSPANSNLEESSTPGSSRSAIGKGRTEDVTDAMRKLNLDSWAAAPKKGKLDDKIEAMLKAVKAPKFYVHYPTLNLHPSKLKSKAPAGPSSLSHVSSTPASRGSYKYNCDCGKGFDDRKGDKGLTEHLAKHTKHREKGRK